MPATTAATATRATVADRTRTDRRRNVQATPSPRMPTPPDQAAAISTICTWSELIRGPRRGASEACRVVGWSRGRLPAVADAPHRDQPDGMRRVVLDLLAQPAH